MTRGIVYMSFPMIRRPFSAVAAFCILISSSSLADTPFKTLSDTDSGYKFLEELQRALCSASPSHICVPSADDCVSGTILVLSRKLTKNDAEQQAREVCSVRGTH